MKDLYVASASVPDLASETVCEAGIRRKLTRLAVALHAKHYSDVAQWQPLEDAYGLIDQIDNMSAGLSKAEAGWQDISTAPKLDRVFVAGWQEPKGRTAGYWYFHEDVTDEKGCPMDTPDASLWRPMPEAPNQRGPIPTPPPLKGS